MTPGLPVGTGGPAVGEPVANENCVSTIRDASPCWTPWLLMDDETTSGPGGVKFTFLGDAEVTPGQMSITVWLWFAEYDEYYFYVRELNSVEHAFITIYFSNGQVICYDAAGIVVTSNYETGRMYNLHVNFDLDAGTYGIRWNNRSIVDNRALGSVGSGNGRVDFGISDDADLDGLFYMDSLRVDVGPFVENEIEPWGGIKAAWR